MNYSCGDCESTRRRSGDVNTDYFVKFWDPREGFPKMICPIRFKFSTYKQYSSSRAFKSYEQTEFTFQYLLENYKIPANGRKATPEEEFPHWPVLPVLGRGGYSNFRDILPQHWPPRVSRAARHQISAIVCHIISLSPSNEDRVPSTL
jgi:hypothetical protein